MFLTIHPAFYSYMVEDNSPRKKNRDTGANKQAASIVCMSLCIVYSLFSSSSGGGGVGNFHLNFHIRCSFCHTRRVYLQMLVVLE